MSDVPATTAERATRPEGPRLVHESWWRRRSTWRWRRRTTFLVAAAGGAGLLAALGPALVLAFLPRIVDAILRKEIGHRLAMGKLELDPWRLRLRAHDLMLVPARGGPAVATCEEADVELDPFRLVHGAWLRSVELRNVNVRVVRREDGKVDVLETILEARSHLPRSTGSVFPIHLGLGRANVAVAFVDEATGESHRLRGTVQAMGLGNLRGGGDGAGERPGRLLLEATGSPFVRRVQVVGEADLAATEPWGRLVARADALDLAALARIIPGARAWGQRLDAELEARFGQRSVPSGKAWTRVAVGPVFVHVDGAPRVLLESVAAEVETAPGRDPFARELVATRPELSVERLEDGALSVAGLVPFPPAPEPAPAAAPDGGVAAETSCAADRLLAHLERALERDAAPAPEPWTGERLSGAPARSLGTPPIGRLVVRGGRVRFRDRAVPGAPELVLEDLGARLELERVDGRRAYGHVHASSPGLVRALDLELVGTARGRSLQGWLEVAAVGLSPDSLEPYLAAAGRQLAVEGGSLRARASFQVSRQTERGFVGEVTLADAALASADRELARVGAFSTRFALDLGPRPRLALAGLRLEGATVLVERSPGGLVRVAGLGERPGARSPLPPSSGPPREPGFDLVVPSVELAGVELHLDDASGADPIRARVVLDATVRDLTLGLPGTASVRARARVPGLVEDLALEGRAFTSAVTPAFVARVRARGLSSDIARDYLGPLGYEVSLEEKTLDARLALAREPALAGGDALVARVSSLVLADARGPALALESGEVRVARLDPAVAVAQVPLVELVGPFVAVEVGDRGTTVARALTKLARPDRELAGPAPVDAAEGRLGASLTLEQARVEGGSLELVEGAGRVTRVAGVRVHLGPLDVGPVDSRRPCDLALRASVAGVASEVQVGGILTPPWTAPRAHLALRASGIDLDAARARAPQTFSAALVHAGSLRAAVDARLRFLRGGGLTGEVSLRDVAFEDDAGRPLASLGEARARIVRLAPDGRTVDVASVDVDRPSLEVARLPSGELRIGGLVTRSRVTALTEADRLRRARGESEPGREPGEAEAAPRELPSVALDASVRIDRFTLASGRVGFTDEAVRDDAGRPFRLVVPEVEANVEDLALGGASEGATIRSFVEVVLDDGGKATLEGSVARSGAGVSGWLTATARGIGLERFTPYAEAASDVTLARGQLGLDASADLSGDRVEGLAKVVLHDLRVRSRTGNPVTGAGTIVVTGVGLTVITDAAGDTTLRLPFSGVVTRPRIGTGGVVGQVAATALANTLQQPFKLVVRPIEEVTGASPVRWVLDRIERKPPELEQPEATDEMFAAGDARLGAGSRDALARTARLVHGTPRIISLRASCGRGDQARALRQGELSGDRARALLARLEGERRSLAAERLDVVAGEMAALEGGDDGRAALARARLADLDARLARLGRSEDELASRVESSDATLGRARAEDALRRLAEDRVAAVRSALVAKGVSRDRIRFRLARLTDERADGRVTIEVSP